MKLDKEEEKGWNKCLFKCLKILFRTTKTINNYQQLNIQQNLNQNLILLKPSISTIGINEKELEIREQQTEFERLVNDYSEHLRCMNRLLTPIEHFLTEQVF